MKAVTAFLAGLLFGSGLVVSGLANPANASLAFVMAAAVIVTGLGYQLARLQGAPLFEPVFQVAMGSPIDGQLLAGAALFGIGWGSSGFCPGPALIALTEGGASTTVFVIAMLAGMWGARFVSFELKPRPQPSR